MVFGVTSPGSLVKAVITCLSYQSCILAHDRILFHMYLPATQILVLFLQLHLHKHRCIHKQTVINSSSALSNRQFYNLHQI